MWGQGRCCFTCLMMIVADDDCSWLIARSSIPWKLPQLRCGLLLLPCSLSFDFDFLFNRTEITSLSVSSSSQFEVHANLATVLLFPFMYWNWIRCLFDWIHKNRLKLLIHEKHTRERFVFSRRRAFLRSQIKLLVLVSLQRRKWNDLWLCLLMHLSYSSIWNLV